MLGYVRLGRGASVTRLFGLGHLANLYLEAFDLVGGQAIAKAFELFAPDGLWNILKQVELPVSLRKRCSFTFIVHREVNAHFPSRRFEGLKIT